METGMTAKWSAGTRIAFRFCFLYIGLFCLSGQIFQTLYAGPFSDDMPNVNELGVLRQLTFWVGANVFHAKLPLVYTGSGSGDKYFDWAWVVCLLTFSAAATVVWSVADRRRPSHPWLFKWFRLFIRFALAGQMIVYGVVKAVPLQMPFPFLTKLMEPYHDFSPMGVLWSSIGSSPGYETFAGCAELLGGILLIFPRTTLLGSLVCLADMIQVFMLNMSYDVPVKILSFHLILLSVFLLAPDLPRLADFFFGSGATRPSAQPELFASRRANRLALGVQVVFGMWLIGVQLYGARSAWSQYGPGKPKSPLYGIWDVEELSTDGQVRPPLVSDLARLRRVVFDSPGRGSFQLMNDKFESFNAVVKPNPGTLALTKGTDKTWNANFTYQRSGADQLILDGEMDHRKTHMQLRLVDHKKFLLVSRGFHWIQDYPFNR